MARWFRWGMVAGFIAGYVWAQRQRQTQPTVDLATFRRQWTEELQWQQRDDFRQYQALLTLRDQLPLRAPLPPMRGYAISPDFAVTLLTLIQELKPKRVLELGCGVSTLVVAYALEQQKAGGRVVSLEHYAEFAERTRATLRLHQLEKTAQVLDAPLKALTLPNWQSDWYDIALLADDEPFDLLIVDGPPQYNNPHPMARYPALPMLIKHLTPNAVIVLDDAHRTNEQLAASHWVREYPLDILPSPEAEKGVLILKRR